MSARFVPVLVSPDHYPSMPFVHGHLHVALADAEDPACEPLDDTQAAALPRSFIDTCHRSIWGFRGRCSPLELESEERRGLWTIRSADGVAASRILCIQDLIRPWPLEGVLIACDDANTLLIAPLEGLSAIAAVRSLLHRPRVKQGLSDQLFWADDNGRWRHVSVVHTDHGAEIGDEPSFLAALERLTAVELVAVAAEA
ncbi:MAG: hypothetical protein AB8H79_14310 [Myxococcota bacterium]